MATIPPVPPDAQVSEGTISAEQLCTWTSLTDRRHRQIAAKGYFPPPILGRYQVGKTLVGMLKYVTEQLRKRDGRQAKEQLKLTTAKRKLAEEELAKVLEKYIEKAVVGPALRNISLHQRAVLQRKLEQELGPQLAGLTTLEIIARIKLAVDEVCQIFREGVGGWMDKSPEPEPKLDPPALAECQPPISSPTPSA